MITFIMVLAILAVIGALVTTAFTAAVLLSERRQERLDQGDIADEHE